MAKTTKNRDSRITKFLRSWIKQYNERIDEGFNGLDDAYNEYTRDALLEYSGFLMIDGDIDFLEYFLEMQLFHDLAENAENQLILAFNEVEEVGTSEEMSCGGFTFYVKQLDDVDLADLFSIRYFNQIVATGNKRWTKKTAKSFVDSIEENFNSQGFHPAFKNYSVYKEALEINFQSIGQD